MAAVVFGVLQTFARQLVDLLIMCYLPSLCLPFSTRRRSSVCSWWVGFRSVGFVRLPGVWWLGDVVVRLTPMGSTRAAARDCVDRSVKCSSEA